MGTVAQQKRGENAFAPRFPQQAIQHVTDRGLPTVGRDRKFIDTPQFLVKVVQPHVDFVVQFAESISAALPNLPHRFSAADPVGSVLDGHAAAAVAQHQQDGGRPICGGLLNGGSQHGQRECQRSQQPQRQQPAAFTGVEVSRTAWIGGHDDHEHRHDRRDGLKPRPDWFDEQFHSVAALSDPNVILLSSPLSKRAMLVWCRMMINTGIRMLNAA